MSMILFVRHGESVANVNRTAAGSRDDCALTERGVRDADFTADNLRKRIADEGLTVDRIISSSLIRAYETAKTISRVALDDLPIQTDARLSERDLGKTTGAPFGSWHSREFDPEMEIETRVAWRNRVVAAFKDLEGLDGNTLVVSHNGTYRVLQAYLNGLSADEFVDVRGLNNGEIVEIPTKGGNDD